MPDSDTATVTIDTNEEASKKKRFLLPSGTKRKHRWIVTLLGRIGFTAKGVIYSILGGLCCASALDEPTPEGTGSNESPQAVFILLAGAQQIGIPLLVVMSVGLLFYSTWRFWEAATGQGSDKTFSRKKNFFKYRLSPFVSGAVYLSYLSYIIQVMVKLHIYHKNNQEVSTSDNCFPNCWNTTPYGRAGIIIIGIAFLIATITQLIPAFSTTFHKDLKVHLYPNYIKYTVLTLGHIGFLGRAGVFLMVAILMFKASSDDIDVGKYTVGAALDQLRANRGTKAILFIIGLFLVFFGAFAILNVKFKYFPTRPNSGEHPRDDNEMPKLSTDDTMDDPVV
ncbi:hypothetical protein K502DRAFT_338960 [Neoconidiobolus thromboides FSU 785]|nr:hypothetical protein K502DRAFT_338960 [Neoconidiobolus thromboides FSU 785]